VTDTPASVPRPSEPSSEPGGIDPENIEPTAPATLGRLADGEWHRLHPMTPLLRGGFAFVAVIGIIIVNLRDFAIELFFNGGGLDGRDPVTWIIEHEFAGILLLAIFGGLLLFIAGFAVSWRMHTFRITDELVEVRSGILFRTNRRGRLDRIQGINITRPFLARLVGAAKLEVNVAGQDANVQLAYLGSAAADALRRDILLLASGTRAEAAEDATPGESGGLIERRVSELLAPELDPNAAPPESVVRMHPGRLIGSILLNEFTIIVLLVLIGMIVAVSLTGEIFWIFGFIPGLIGLGGFYISRFTRSLRYSIAGTPDGVRVGFGLLSTSNETLPPGRIHAVMITQPLLWRPAGWWQITINRASQSATSGAAGNANTTILPVGTIADVRKVLELVLPAEGEPDALDTLARGLVSRGGDEFTTSPRRAAILRWFSWRRNGFLVTDHSVVVRTGAIWRSLFIVPHARIQSLVLAQGPLMRRVGVAAVGVHTVAGPVSVRVGAIDQDDAIGLFEAVAEAAVHSAGADTSHQWRRDG
jgi:putative membrane protein